MREMAHDFAEKEMRPVAWEYDKEGTWPQELVDKAWELGLMNGHLPAEYGGPGLGYFDGTLIEEELAWGCSGVATSLTCNGLATAPIALAASEELKKDYLGRLSEAPLLASFCLTEPDAGSDVSRMKTTATKKGDKWIINGSKCFITNGEYANYYTVYAKTDKEAGHRGISCFIVPRMPASSSTSTRTRWVSARRTPRRSRSLRSRSPRPPRRRGEQGVQDRDDDP